MRKQWWTPEAVQVALQELVAAWALSDKPDESDAQDFLTALTPFVERVVGDAVEVVEATWMKAYDDNRREVRAEAFEEAKRIVRVQLGANRQALAVLAGSEVGAIRLVRQRLRALEDVHAALDRAAGAAPAVAGDLTP